MRRRDARRIALGLVASSARIHMDDGEYRELLVGDPDDPLSSADADKVMAEVAKIADGLSRQMQRLGD